MYIMYVHAGTSLGISLNIEPYRALVTSCAAQTGAAGNSPLAQRRRLLLPQSLAGKCTAVEKRESEGGTHNGKDPGNTLVESKAYGM